MSLANRLSRAPLPHDAAAAAEIRADFGDLDPDLTSLVAGAAGCSPYLKSLLEHERDWIRQAVAQDPETACAEVLDAIDIGGEAPSPDALGTALRQAKRRIALLAALADLGGAWGVDAVTGALTDLADRATQAALHALLAEEIRRRKLPGMGPDDAAGGAGMVVLAMGKMGARELNYSSDIDLICLFDESRFDPDDYHDARAAFIRVTRKLCALLSDRTGEGYVFRTDLRLRPDPSVTPVCLSMEAAERYYESLGRTWERAAYIKARVCAGDRDAGARFLKTLVPFVWRRHLDFAAIQDAHDMRLRIRDHKGLGGALVLEGHNLKLGQGGIREIEFFTQTRQIIAGGRDPDLRSPRTVDALGQLAVKGWVPVEVADELARHYLAHREVEHRLQMVQDAQTQILPGTAEGFERLARFMGQGDTEAFRRDLLARLARVAELAEGFFEASTPRRAASRPEVALSQTAHQIVAGWPAYAALRSERAQQIFKRVRPEILNRLQKAGDPDEALIQFDRFLGGLPAGVQLFSLFEANPQLIDLIVDICATAPRLAAYLSRNAAVFDAVIGGDFFAPWPDVMALQTQLADHLGAAGDYERKLDAARVWAREWHFRIGVHHLRGLIDAFEAGSQYAALAESVLAALWPHVVEEFASRHGPPPGRGAVVLGMGSLGAGRLNAASDLDLIVIYDAQGAEASEGHKPLNARTYYARLTQAFVTALSAPMAQGRLYEVDMRLRPSGRQGPVATSLDAFCTYQREEAWTWEHLALTRARRVAGSVELGHGVEDFRHTLLSEKGAGARVGGDVAAMRAKLASAKPARGNWAAKDGPGRIQDIELLAQFCALRAGSAARRVEAQLLAGRRAGVIGRQDEAQLLSAYRLCWRLQCSGRLLADRIDDVAALGQGGRALILRETQQPDLASLQQALATRCDSADQVITALLDKIAVIAD